MKFVYDMARIHLIWYMEENLEILGTEKMSFISMVGSSWPLLHSRQAGEQELATPRSLPPMHPRRGNNQSSPLLMCFHPTILVSPPTVCWSEQFSSTGLGNYL
jgi:hypothetical protein